MAQLHHRAKLSAEGNLADTKGTWGSPRGGRFFDPEAEFAGGDDDSASVAYLWFVIVLFHRRGRAKAARWADSLFSEKAHNFGAVPSGAKVKYDFVLTNRLAEPITILNLRPSCGCTSGKASASTVNPGDRR